MQFQLLPVVSVPHNMLPVVSVLRNMLPVVSDMQFHVNMLLACCLSSALLYVA